MVPAVVLILAISGIILGASVITLSEFGDTMTQCYNTSFKNNRTDNSACNNNTLLDAVPQGEGGLNLSAEYYGIVQSNEGLGTVAEQQNTLAIIAIMVIIISLIAGVFVYFTKFR